MARKTVVAQTREEAYRLRGLNAQYREDRKYWKVVDVEEPNYIMVMVGRIDRCPRCGSGHVEESYCTSCCQVVSEVQCLDCGAYWQMEMPEGVSHGVCYRGKVQGGP